MSINPYRELPRDKNGNAMQGVPPAFTALQRFSSENATTSSVVTLNDNTTFVEVLSLGVGAALRWVASTDTQASVVSAAATANYDVLLSPNSVKRLAIPQEKVGVSSIVGLGVQAGLYRRMAWKTFGVGSIMSAEY